MDPFHRRLLIALITVVVLFLGLWLYHLWTRRSGAAEPPGLPPPPPPPATREKVVLSESVRQGQVGSMFYRGSVWALKNEAGRDLKEGEVVFVERVEVDHTLVVTAAGGFVGNP